MSGQLQPDDPLARWAYDIRRFVAQAPADRVEEYNAAVVALTRLERWIEASTLSKFCATCGRPFVIAAQARAWLQSCGKRLPTLCPACRGGSRP